MHASITAELIKVPVYAEDVHVQPSLVYVCWVVESVTAAVAAAFLDVNSSAQWFDFVYCCTFGT